MIQFIISSITRIVPQQTAHTYRKVNEICLIQLQKQLTFPVHLNINDLLKSSIIFLEIFNFHFCTYHFPVESLVHNKQDKDKQTKSTTKKRKKMNNTDPVNEL